MSTQHTPGPWTSIVPPSSCYTHRFIQAERGGDANNQPDITIAEVGGRYSSEDERVSVHEHVANAKLIAAAPELLQALRAMLRWTGALPPSESRDLPDFTEADATCIARAAIAKATAQ